MTSSPSSTSIPSGDGSVVGSLNIPTVSVSDLRPPSAPTSTNSLAKNHDEGHHDDHNRVNDDDPSSPMSMILANIPSDVNFHAVDYVNNLFPTEASFDSEIDLLLSKLQATILHLDQSLAATVRKERHGGARSAREVNSAVEKLATLRENVAHVKVKAMEAEASVQAATKEIQPLDCAMRNLRKTAETIRAMVDLEDAIERCEKAATSLDPLEIALCGTHLMKIRDTLPSFDFISSTSSASSASSSTTLQQASENPVFPGVANNNKISSKTSKQTLIESENFRKLPELQKRAANVKHSLCSIVIEEFKTHALGKPGPHESEMGFLRLQACCKVADQLGADLRAHIISLYLNDRTKAYYDTFPGPYPINNMMTNATVVKQLHSQTHTSSVTSSAPSIQAASTITPGTTTHSNVTTVSSITATTAAAPTSDEPFKASHRRTASSGADNKKTSIQSTEMRFAWLRREIRYYEERGWSAVLPASWNVCARMCATICEAIREFVVSELRKKVDVDLMLLVLQQCVDFERELQSIFAKTALDDADETLMDSENTERIDSGADGNISSTATSKRDTANHVNLESVEGHVDNRYNQPIVFLGLISSSFESYMGAFVSSEDKHLEELLNRLMIDETWKLEAQSPVLKSSTELLIQIKKSMRRTFVLTRGQTIFEIYKVYKKHLTAYAKSLYERITSKPVLFGYAAQKYGGRHKLSDTENQAAKEKWENEIIVSTVIIDTADYCAKMCDQLSELLKKHVEDMYVSQITLMPVKEEFLGTAAHAIRSIIRFIEPRLDAAFSSILQIKWGKLSSIGDASNYVAAIDHIFHTSIGFVGKNLSTKYYRFFLERLASVFFVKYVNTLYKCHNITSLGSQQLLVDAKELTGILRSVPNKLLEQREVEEELNMMTIAGPFTKIVDKEFLKLESVLKVLSSPTDGIVDTYIAIVTEGSASELQKILELRGVDRGMILQSVLAYAKKTGPSSQTTATIRSLSTDPHGKNTQGVNSGMSDWGATSTTGLRVEGGGSGKPVPMYDDSALDTVRSMFAKFSNTVNPEAISHQIENFTKFK